ncbi:hypothetical protein [Pseudomonas matsuisoli]|uniref:Uncharacterized protein n=1 Tax=Pseudomonas matsuisoli TaxID=1515666 RepID=A0A917PRG0_9PSED|nr:hypothetical protein [Pseudomonas matsuisoli]GGJ88410.1 hypothetical protein GCM10009304_12650 [Pseudomonas matsuisoli]
MNARVAQPVHLSLVKPALKQVSRHNSVKGIIRLADKEGRVKAEAYLKEQEAKLTAMQYALQYDQTLESLSTYSSHLEEIDRGTIEQPDAVRYHLECLVEQLNQELTRLGELVPEMKDYTITWS